MWFLIFAAMGQQEIEIGPLNKPSCQEAVETLRKVPSILMPRCQKAVAFHMCTIDGQPGAYRACPVFDWSEYR